MKRYITTIKYFLPLLFIVSAVFFGRGAPTAYAGTVYSQGGGTDVFNITANYNDNDIWYSPNWTAEANAYAPAIPAFYTTTSTVDRIQVYRTTGTSCNRYSASLGSGPYSFAVLDNNGGTTHYYYATSVTAVDANICEYTISIPSGKTLYSIGESNLSTSIVGNYGSGGYSTTQAQTAHVDNGGFAFQLCDSGSCGSFPTAHTCVDGIMNGDETGIDIGGSCQELTINTPVDTTDVQDFNNFSVTYTGVDIPDQNHQVLVQWSDNSALLTTCENGVAGSLYTGSFVAGSSYSVCTNSVPRIYIDLNTISFSAGITSYTGSVPKTHSLTNGTTYYAQAFIMGTDGFYYVASPVISFTASNGVPIVTGNGTITNGTGSGTITGTGTHFTSTLHIGDTLTVGGQQCKVLSIASDTELECTPLTSSHTGSAYTQNSNFDSSVLQETCSTWDFGCYIKNTITWFFGVSDTSLQNFGTLKDTLSSRFPFSYISDVGTLFGETFNQSADSFSLDIDLMGNSFTVLSTAQLEAIPFQSLVRTIMGAMAMFFTVMFIYRKIIKVHDANHHTA